MGEERQEVYERIPWETLERKGGDRQWLLIAVAGAVTVGALAYSFMQNQPAPAPEALAQPVVTAAPPVAVVPPATVTTITTPLLLAEADLYAVDPVDLGRRAAAHAEWFAIEYFAFDGSEQSRSSLQALLPAGLPLPEAPTGAQVFVDWVGTQSVTESGPLQFSVEVVIRSLLSEGDGAFTRQPPRLATVEVSIGEDGRPVVLRPPSVSAAAPAVPVSLTLTPLPIDLQAQVEASHGPVVGGELLADGRWRVVAMVSGLDGVSRPETVVLP